MNNRQAGPNLSPFETELSGLGPDNLPPVRGGSWATRRSCGMAA